MQHLILINTLYIHLNTIKTATVNASEAASERRALHLTNERHFSCKLPGLKPNRYWNTLIRKWECFLTVLSLLAGFF